MKIKKLKISNSPNSRNLKILAIGDTHGDLRKVKQIPIKGVDLILLTGDLGSSDLMRKMHFVNIERQKQGLAKIEYSPKQKKVAFMESYSSTIHMVKYLAKFAPVYVIFGNVENSNSDTREISKEIGMKLPFLSDSFKKISRVRIINNIVANFRGLRIGGLEYFTDASWVREFKPSNYQENLRAVLKQNKKTKIILRNFGTVDILLCHQPPYGILDKVSSKIAPKRLFLLYNLRNEK